MCVCLSFKQKIAWFKLSDLPTWKKNKVPPQGMGGKFYLISPFIGKLKQWIQENKPQKVAAIAVSNASQEPASKRAIGLAEEEESDVQSDNLKALLGLGQNETLQTGKGREMIEEQGDARSRQLLDLLQGDSSATNAVENQRDVPDERESGTATLLAALDAGAGKVTQLPQKVTADSEILLSMLKGPASVSAPATTLSFPRSSSPLLAPQPQNTSQAQSLLSLISPGNTTAPVQSASTEDKERERAKQRDALLNGLLGSSSSFNTLSVQPDERHVDHFQFPQVANPPSSINPPPVPTLQQNNLLSLLQPPKTSSNGLQYPAPTPSPFSTFVQQQASQVSPPVNPQIQNPLLSLLNDNASNVGGAQAVTSPPPLSYHSPYPPPPIQSPYPIHQQGYSLPQQVPPLQFMAYPPPPSPFHSGYLAQAASALHNPYQSIISPLPPPPPPLPPQHFHHHPPSSHQATSDVLARLLPS